ncbi:hypothetical protein TSUD_321830 [Trifolium subterraneum]|uniref:Uncharacterized protein n=1 Tax=Trifolium subterraneum TaxID=3900 RepID=A0A2Z6MUM7_TRISU|nr:hypothetical protein TSUD_321830 [Trifolium subterraneum]
MVITPFGNASATQWGIPPQIIAGSTTIAKHNKEPGAEEKFKEINNAYEMMRNDPNMTNMRRQGLMVKGIEDEDYEEYRIKLKLIMEIMFGKDVGPVFDLAWMVLMLAKQEGKK